MLRLSLRLPSELSALLVLGFCLALIAGPVYGQGPAARWAVGRAGGVNFNTRPASAWLNVAPAYQPGEGGASIADAAGNLLFYTDGTQIWNRTQALMPNSSGLGGHVSSSQSALIVRQPGQERYYWVFTTDAIESFPGSHRGLRYTVVDMNANGGLGGIDPARKSVALAANTTEKLTACAAANGIDVWIIGHEFGSARFLAWRLTEQGLASATPVASTIGTAQGSAAGGNYNPGRGCHKASPDGSLLASVILPPVQDRYVAELFRFDNATGRVTERLADFSEPAAGANDFNFYGVEFSPSGGRLYISTRKGPYQVLQYDLCAPNIAATRTVVGSSTNQFGTLQLGPDGRIYAAKNSDAWLGVIQNPEGLGTTCTYREQGLNLTGRTSTYGLNNLNASLFYRSRLDVSGQSGCQGQALNFSAQALTCGVARAPQLAYSWNFADPASGSANTAQGLQASHIFSRAGTYRVVLTGRWGELADTASVLVRVEGKPTGLVARLDSNWCQGTQTLSISLAGQPGSTPGLWAQAGGAAAEVTAAPGQLTVRTGANGNAWVHYIVRSTTGCAGDTQRLAWQVNQQPAPAITGPADVCLGQPLPTYRPAAAGSYRFVYDGAAASAPATSFTLPANTPAGTHTLALAGGIVTATRTCYTDGPALAINLRANAPIKTRVWDSAHCPEAPGSRYELDLPDALADSARWTIDGLHQVVEQRPGMRQLVWAAEVPRVSVTVRTTPGCPPRTLSTPIAERCLEVMNIVTANADDKNDHFYIHHLESYPGAEVQLYARHGQRVLATTATSNADFKQTELPAGTYFYHVRYQAGGVWRQKRGWVEVVR